MPTIFRYGPYRLFFFSNEGNEPIHVHVEASGKHAKFWIGPVRLAKSTGFVSHELADIRNIIEGRIDEIVKKWNEHFQGS